MITTPKVVEEARKIFDCENLEGVPLEQSNIGVHWEMSVLFDDLMTADNPGTRQTTSTITLALFEDSGWYKADLRYG